MPDLDAAVRIQNNIRYGTNIREHIPLSQKLYNLKRILRNEEEIEVYTFYDLKRLYTQEQEIPRPKYTKKKKEYYSQRTKIYCKDTTWPTIKEKYCINQDITQERKTVT